MNKKLLLLVSLLIGCKESTTNSNEVDVCEIDPKTCQNGVKFVTKESNLTVHFNDKGIDAFESFGVKISLEGSQYGSYRIFRRSDLDSNNSLTLKGDLPVLGSGNKLYADLRMETNGIAASIHQSFPADGENHTINVTISGRIMICTGAGSACAIGTVPDTLPLVNHENASYNKLIGQYRDTNLIFGVEKVLTLDSAGGYYIKINKLSNGTLSGFFSELSPQVGKVQILSDSTLRLWPIFCTSTSEGFVSDYSCSSYIHAYGQDGAISHIGGFTK